MDFIKNWFGRRGVEYHELNTYDIKSVGRLVVPETLTHKNAFTLANSVSEFFFPCDFCADRVSKLRFYIAKNDREVKTTELNRFISDINPFFTFSELVYQFVFSLVADGNAHNKLGVPSLYGSDPKPSNISRWDVLQPNLVELSMFNNVSQLTYDNVNSAIKKIEYNDVSKSISIDVNNYRLFSLGGMRRYDNPFMSHGLLMKANKSADILLSVYSARYNVYANNGAAGYLAKKSGSAASSFEQAISDESKRQEILDDINNRNGVTGKRNIWGISGVPIEFVKTLATISELMPLDETLECSIKICAPFQIPAGLVPRKDQSTYNNQEADERKVWENGLLSLSQTVCDQLTRLFGLDKIGYKIAFDKSSVSALNQNESERQDIIAKKIANIKAMREIMPEYDLTSSIESIYNDLNND